MFVFNKVALAAAVSLGLFSGTALAEVVKIKDIAGREVEVNVPVERVILGEGRQIYFTAALDTEKPFGRVVGWRDDFKKADLDGYNAYLEKFPEMDKLPTFGGMKDGTFDIEQAIALKPDVIIMNTEAKSATEESGYIEKLERSVFPCLHRLPREAAAEHRRLHAHHRQAVRQGSPRRGIRRLPRRADRQG